MALSSVSAQLTVAREHALLGDYSSAMVYYAGLLSQIDRYTTPPNIHIALPYASSCHERLFRVQAHANSL